MTTCLGKSCSSGLPRVPFVNCCQFMYLIISILVLRAECGIWSYQFLIIAYLFTLSKEIEKFHYSNLNFCSLNKIFTSTLNKRVPIKEKRVKYNRKVEWLNDDIVTAQKNRDYYHKHRDWKNFKRWRNKTKTLIRSPKKEFFENAIKENKDFFLWKHVINITGEVKTRNLPE